MSLIESLLAKAYLRQVGGKNIRPLEQFSSCGDVFREQTHQISRRGIILPLITADGWTAELPGKRISTYVTIG